MKISSIRVTLAAWIAPAGTTIVPPLRSTPLPRADIARTPPSIPGMTHVMIPRANRPSYSDVLIIEQCRDPSMWYAKHIGELFPNLGHMDGDWKTRDSSGFINVIRITDAKPVRTRPLPMKS